MKTNAELNAMPLNERIGWLKAMAYAAHVKSVNAHLKALNRGTPA